MRLRNPLITSRVTGRAASMPLPLQPYVPFWGSVYAARDPRAPWRPGNVPVEEVAALRGTIVPLATPQAYEAARRLKHPLQYAWQTARGRESEWLAVVGVVAVSLTTASALSHLMTPESLLLQGLKPLGPFAFFAFIGGVLGLPLLLGTLASVYLLPRGVEGVLRLLRERPLVLQEYRSLREAVALFPSSPLALLYPAWRDAPDEETREGVEALWRGVLAEERTRLREAQAPQRAALEEALEEERRQEEATLQRREEERNAALDVLEARVLSSKDPLLPLAVGEGLPPQEGLQDGVPSP